MNKRKFAIDWDKVTKKIKEQNAGAKNFKDERIYYPQVKDDGTAQAIIRFLPSNDTDIPFVKVYSHGFKGPGGWLIENCPTTLGQDCPVCKANQALWETDEKTARPRSRKLSYYSNIQVVKDPQNPENEGKVFIFRYGKKIHEKIMEKLSPDEGGIVEPIMVFDYYDGANFNLIIKRVKAGNQSFPNYDSSFFDGVSPVGTDAEIEKIDGDLHQISEFVSEGQFKSYEELSEKMVRVTGATAAPAPTAEAPTATETAPAASTADAGEAVFDADDDDDAFFKKLQEEEA